MRVTQGAIKQDEDSKRERGGAEDPGCPGIATRVARGDALRYVRGVGFVLMPRDRDASTVTADDLWEDTSLLKVAWPHYLASDGEEPSDPHPGLEISTVLLETPEGMIVKERTVGGKADPQPLFPGVFKERTRYSIRSATGDFFGMLDSLEDAVVAFHQYAFEKRVDADPTVYREGQG